MITESRAPRGEEWNGAVDALHGLANALAVRSHYSEGHPAILRADETTTASFVRLLDHLPELVIALIEGEVVVCERPMPELRQRLGAVIEAMVRHDVECIVFQRGMTATECTLLARTLAERTANAAMAREAQTGLAHILLRYAELRLADDQHRRGAEARTFSSDARELLAAIEHQIAVDEPFDFAVARSLAGRILDAVNGRVFAIEQRCLATGDDGSAEHASNVAVIVAAMALEARLAREEIMDVTAAALLHDVGKLALPPSIRGVPEPLLDESSRSIFRNHSFAGARLLLGWGCPPLWVAAALEHHRGVDGKGYPSLSSTPHPIIRWIALANFIDCKRAKLVGRDGALEADDAFRLACGLSERYFAAADLRLFQRAIGVFPPGTTVELSDRQVGLVTQASPGDPLRPQVELVLGANARKRTDLKTLDAVEDRHVVSIVRAIPPPLIVREGAPIVEEPPVPEPLPPSAPKPEPVPEPMRRMSGAYSSLQKEVEIQEAPPPVITMPPTISAPPKALVQDEAYKEELERTFLERLGSLEKIPVLKVSPSQLSKLALDHKAGFILSMIDGMTPIETLIDMSGIAKIDVLRILDDLLQSGAIALE